jgi:hypothetical protein
VSALARHTSANREFFARGKAPHVSQWVDWIKRGVIRGKVIDGQPWVDLNWFAANNNMDEAVAPSKTRIHGADLLRRGRSANL